VPPEPRSQGSSKLTVGTNIKLEGVEITDCDTLMVEGIVEANMVAPDADRRQRRLPWRGTIRYGNRSHCGRRRQDAPAQPPSKFRADLGTRHFAQLQLAASDAIRQAVAVLPVAAIEQYGPHLPAGAMGPLLPALFNAAACPWPSSPG